MVDEIPKINTLASSPTPAKGGEAIKTPVVATVSETKARAVPPTGRFARIQRLPRWAKIVSVVLGVLLLLGVAIAIPALRTLQAAKTTIALAQETYAAGKNQNLPEFNKRLEQTRGELVNTHRLYKVMIWTRLVPLLGGYWSDGDHAFKAAIAGVEAAQILGTTIEPYADVLGFQGQGSFMGGTAEERITKAVETLDKITPELDRIAQKALTARDQMMQIRPNRYPFTIKGRNLKETIIAAQTFAQESYTAVTDAKPLLERVPAILGIEEERKYLVLFQNDAELRPTGGFMTAYGILRVEKGKVFQEKSDDIYNLDSKFNKRLKPPELIDNYLPLVFYWNLRDMNLSPDFKESMATFYSYYKDVPGEPEVDGIISVDTQVLKDIVTVLGPIDVPSYGTFTAENDSRCDCPQIIYELENTATRPVAYVKSDRKGFLAPMLQTILLKTYGSPKNVWPPLFSAVIKNMNEKHVLFYFFEDEEQQAVEAINFGGRIKEAETDYLHLNDINFAGAKSNLFVTEDVEQQITIGQDGSVTKKVTVTYKNPAPASNCNLEAGELCLNGILRDVVRLYVPKGSTLKEGLGFEEGTVETYDELGKTVFQGFFTLSPESQAKVIFEYTLPFQVQDEYGLLIQKQPGKKLPHYTILVNGELKEEFDLATDREIKLTVR